MEDKTTKQLLRDPEQTPNEELFKSILSEQLLQTYQEIQQVFLQYKLSADWIYYKDGKSWLCKVTHKKKTVVWVSLWENHFKSSFYFTEKNRNGIANLAIDIKLKESFSQAKAIGKLLPFTLILNNVEDLRDFIKLVEYKRLTL